jgi:hypothetical protein
VTYTPWKRNIACTGTGPRRPTAHGTAAKMEFRFRNRCDQNCLPNGGAIVDPLHSAHRNRTCSLSYVLKKKRGATLIASITGKGVFSLCNRRRRGKRFNSFSKTKYFEKGALGLPSSTFLINFFKFSLGGKENWKRRSPPQNERIPAIIGGKMYFVTTSGISISLCLHPSMSGFLVCSIPTH